MFIGVLAVGIAKQSLQLSLVAAQTQSELQERMARHSLQQFLSLHHQEMLQEQANMTCHLELGGTRYQILLADESRKLHLPTLAKYASQSEFEGELRRTGLPLRSHSSRVKNLRYPAWSSYFNLSSPPTNGWGERLAAATKEVTCWGQGDNATTLDRLKTKVGTRRNPDVASRSPSSTCWTAWVFAGRRAEHWVWDASQTGSRRLLVDLW
jgi:hypothetical protein